MNSSNSDSHRTIRLTSGVFRLDRHDQTLHVVYGYAWVTMGGQDILLTKGDEVHITREDGSVLVEALRERPLLFQIYLN